MSGQDLRAALAAPFPADRIEWRVSQETRDGSKVMVLAYLTSRAVMERLDEVFGPFGWEDSYEPGPHGGVKCTLVCRDPETGERCSKQDGAENTQVEAVKGGYSAALKRVAVKWGIGRYLYDLPTTWVPVSERRAENYHRSKNLGKAVYWDSPMLPAWALPEGASRHKQKPARALPTQNPKGAVAQGAMAEGLFGTLRATIEQCEMVTQLEVVGSEIRGAAKNGSLNDEQVAQLRAFYKTKLTALGG